MDPFWLIDEAWRAKVRAAQRGAAAAQPSATESGSPFLAQVGQALGEETEPDAEFFVDSWTVGVAEASENFQRRNKEHKTREHELPQWAAFSTFPPFFHLTVEASPDAASQLRESRAQEYLTADRRSPADNEWDDWGADQPETASPLTVESACRILGVTATSTREQIRAAYRKMAGRYHPDRLAQAGPREQKLASDRMASINEAYRLLCAGLVQCWSPCFS